MKFILKDNYIFPLDNAVETGGKVVADVVIKYVEDFNSRKFSYSINNKKFAPIVNEQIVFEEEDLKGTYIDLKIKADGPSDTIVFKADRIPLTYVVVFGENVEEAYPSRIRAIEKEMAHLKQTSLKILDYVAELEKKGRLL